MTAFFVHWAQIDLLKGHSGWMPIVSPNEQYETTEGTRALTPTSTTAHNMKATTSVTCTTKMEMDWSILHEHGIHSIHINQIRYWQVTASAVSVLVCELLWHGTSCFTWCGIYLLMQWLLPSQFNFPSLSSQLEKSEKDDTSRWFFSACGRLQYFLHPSVLCKPWWSTRKAIPSIP